MISWDSEAASSGENISARPLVHRESDPVTDRASNQTSRPDSVNERPPLLRRLLQGMAWGTVNQFASSVGSLLVTPLLVHTLGLDAFGLFSLVLLLNSMLSSFDGGLRPVAGRFFSVHIGAGNRVAAGRLLGTLMLFAIGVGLAITTVLFFVSPTLVAIFRLPRDLRVDGLFLFRSVGVLVGAVFIYTVLESVMQALGRYTLTGFARLLSYVAWVTTTWVCTASGYGLKVLAIALIAPQVAAACLLVPAVIKYVGPGNLGLADITEVRALASFGWRAQCAGLATLVNTQFDGILIGLILPVRYVGLYNAGANVANKLSNALSNALVPLANHFGNRFGSEGVQAVSDILNELQPRWVRITSAWCAVCAAVSYPALSLWLGKRFEVSGLVCAILLLGYLFNNCVAMQTLYVNAIGLPGLQARFGLVSVIINVGLTAAMIPFGITGIVGATAAGLVLGSLYFQRLVRSKTDSNLVHFLTNIPFDAILASLAASGLSAWLILFTGLSGPLGLIAAIACIVPGLATFIALSKADREALQVAAARARMTLRTRRIISADS